MGDVGLGIVGLGTITKDVHLPSVEETNRVELRAVADITPARREALASALSCRIYASLGELLEHDGVDLVIVATPSSMHHEHVMEALSAGKHVMVEKPMAINLTQARQMAAEARRRGLILTVHHNRRFHGDFQMLRRLVSSGRAGRLISVEVRFHYARWITEYAAQEYRPDWRLERAYGGGNLLDWGPHFLDQLVQLVGAAPRTLMASLISARWTSDVDDFLRVNLFWPDGTLGVIEASYVSPDPLPQWNVVGSDATITQAKWGEPLVVTPIVGEPEEFAEEPRAANRILDNLVSAVRGTESLEITLDECLLTMELIEAARLSHEAGKSIELPLDTRLDSGA